MKAPFSNKPTWMRVAIGAVAGLILVILINIFGSGSAGAAEPKSSDFAGVSAETTYNEPWERTCKGSLVPDVCQGLNDRVTSPDARQALGNTLGGCAVGAALSGPPGCLGGFASGIIGSIPWDGTWD